MSLHAPEGMIPAEKPVTDPATSVGNALRGVRREIEIACHAVSREPSSVTLVAVSKTFPAAAVEPAIAAGQLVFGENRVQEAKGKWPQLRGDHPGLTLHLVGPLQSNKVKDAFALFDVIHSVDRDSLGVAMSKEIARIGRHPKLLVQVNTGAEPQKAGVLPEDADAFIERCRKSFGLTISGLMCVPPVDQVSAPHFEILAGIAARNGLQDLSMGMSGDFKVAIACGSTYVRIGTAIFGGRSKV
jgi:PLP dependent protein